jgi:hypothetical protein
MTVEATTTEEIMFSGNRTLNSSAARPHRALRRTPVMDPAHATYLADVITAAKNHGEVTGLKSLVLDNLMIGIPAYAGVPLLLTTKVIIDGLVKAGLVRDDKCDIVRSLVTVRIDPSVIPATRVWLNKTMDTDPSFIVPGVAAPALYIPVNADPKFKTAPKTPRAYEKALESEFEVTGGSTSAILDPPMGCRLDVFFNTGEPVDVDNVGLRVLDFLEVMRGEGRGPLLLDEIISVIQVTSTQDVTAGSLQFRFHAPNGVD